VFGVFFGASECHGRLYCNQMNNVDISLLICTWNRADLLRQTLDSLMRIEVPSGVKWEVVVVDNNCTDHTRDVVLECKPNFDLKYVFEAKAGLSFARNAALDAAQGEVLLWTDDDVIVDVNWVKNMLDCHTELNADIVFGRVEPLWGGKQPIWYSSLFNGRFALLDLGRDRWLTKTDSGFGVNHSAVRNVYEKIGRFRTDLGIRPIEATNVKSESYAAGGGEDSYFFEQAHKLGLRVAYCGDSVLKHYIPPDRCEKMYHRRRAWFACEQYLKKLKSPGIATVFGVPRYMLRIFFRDLFSYLYYSICLRKSEAFFYELEALTYFGLVDAARREKK
jgi:glycosyltransferase involved in cell wall biosynthesis